MTTYDNMATYEELLQQQQELAQQIEVARQREMAGALEQVRTLVDKYDLSPREVFPGRRLTGATPATKATRKVPPKYRDPVSGRTWSGRGKAPKWIDGQDRTRFLIV